MTSTHFQTPGSGLSVGTPAPGNAVATDAGFSSQPEITATIDPPTGYRQANLVSIVDNDTGVFVIWQGNGTATGIDKAALYLLDGTEVYTQDLGVGGSDEYCWAARASGEWAVMRRTNSDGAAEISRWDDSGRTWTDDLTTAYSIPNPVGGITSDGASVFAGDYDWFQYDGDTNAVDSTIDVNIGFPAAFAVSDDGTHAVVGEIFEPYSIRNGLDSTPGEPYSAISGGPGTRFPGRANSCHLSSDGGEVVVCDYNAGTFNLHKWDTDHYTAASLLASGRPLACDVASTGSDFVGVHTTDPLDLTHNIRVTSFDTAAPLAENSILMPYTGLTGNNRVRAVRTKSDGSKFACIMERSTQDTPCCVVGRPSGNNAGASFFNLDPDLWIVRADISFDLATAAIATSDTANQLGYGKVYVCAIPDPA